MKRLVKILLSIFLIVPSALGICFISPKLAPENTLITSNGGGGANSLDSPKIAGNSDFERDNCDANIDAEDPSNNANQEETITEYTYKTYDDYFTDYNITSETISDADLTGTGTASDPYLCHSTRGFLYLTNKSVSGIDLNSKYIELCCDVVLNDETFDKDGKPSGGDGVVYQWEPPITSVQSIDGRKNKICGIYVNTPTISQVALFGGYTKISSLSNLNFDNFYLCGNRDVYVIVRTLKNIENVNIYNGYIIGKDRYHAPFSNVIENGYNCNSYATINSRMDASGICIASTKLEKCNNYGSVSTTGNNCAGIVANAYNGRYCELVDCNNYGKIKGGAQIAGIYSSIPDKTIIIRNCNNYADINGGGYMIGGIVGMVSMGSSCFIISCNNYGNITNSKFETFQSAGLLIGQVEGFAFVKDCKVNIENQTGNISNLVGYVYRSSSKLACDNIEFSIKNFVPNYYILFRVEDTAIVEIKNIDINLKSKTANSMILMRLGVKNSEVKIENMICKTNFYFTNEIIYKDRATFLPSFEGVVLSRNNERKEYYGSDFSNFYIDYKTEIIGLKTLSGNGFYQGNVTEDVLINKGFVKKDIA